jgi:hypothetical protein
VLQLQCRDWHWEVLQSWHSAHHIVLLYYYTKPAHESVQMLGTALSQCSTLRLQTSRLSTPAGALT